MYMCSSTLTFLLHTTPFKVSDIILPHSIIFLTSLLKLSSSLRILCCISPALQPLCFSTANMVIHILHSLSMFLLHHHLIVSNILFQISLLPLYKEKKKISYLHNANTRSNINQEVGKYIRFRVDEVVLWVSMTTVCKLLIRDITQQKVAPIN